MTGRTHDLFAFTTLTYIIATQPLHKMTLATAAVAFGANMLGGLFPDLDEASADIWKKVRGGSIIGKLIQPLLGGHRLISHSILGIVITGWVLDKVLSYAKSFLIVDMQVVWWAFMLGYVSHLLIDTITKEGVPWFFPIPWKIGFPPFRFLRITTGELVEKSIVFPGLLILNGYIIYTHYSKFYDFLTNYIVR